MMRRVLVVVLVVFISCIASSNSLQLRKKNGKKGEKSQAPADEDADKYANDVASEIEKNIQDVRIYLFT